MFGRVVRVGSLGFALCLCAQAAPPAPPTEAELAAEARRLSGEIGRSATRSNWVALERHYLAAVATGAPLAAEVHVHGAHAARDRGDLGAARDRLLAVLAVDSTHAEAIATLGDLDRRFGRVDLIAPLRSNLEDYDAHFDPAMQRAVEFGRAQLGATGAFRGLLPPGAYAIDGDPFEVVAGGEVVLHLTGPPALPADPNLGRLRR